MSKYLQQFLQLKSSGDIINAVTPVRKFGKEITEAMAIRQELRKIVLPEPMKYNVIDACAGNCLTGVLSIFTLPINLCISTDIKNTTREGFKDVKRWQYQKADIYDTSSPVFTLILSGKPSILVGCHTCGKLSERLIKIYELYDDVKGLIIIPCCLSPKFNYRNPLNSPQFVIDKLGSYELWCLHLTNMLKDLELGTVKAKADLLINSPANIVITALKT